MAKPLAPAMVRVGGTAGDFIIFEERTKLNQESNFTMNNNPVGCSDMFVEAVGMQ